MRKAWKIVGLSAAAGLVVAGVSLFSLYEASQQVPEFYRRAIGLDADEQGAGRDQFVAQATALASDLHRSGHWQTLFSDAQINAWLALELATNYPDLLPPDLREPRVAFRNHEATIACRYHHGDVTAVLSLSVDVYLQDANVLAVRIRRARAGALPVPLAQVLDAISQAARQLNVRLEWRKAHGDPVALVTFPQPRAGKADAVRFHAIELREGELFASGTIGPSSEGAPAEPPDRQAMSHPAEASDDDHPLVGEASKTTRQE